MTAYEEFKKQLENILKASEEKLEKKNLEEKEYDKLLFQLKNYLSEYENLVKVMLTPDGLIPAESPDLRPEEVKEVPFGGGTIKARCIYTPELADQIPLDHKSAGRLFLFIKNKASKMADNGIYGCSSDVMADIIKEYYALDDKAAFEKEEKEKEKKKAKEERDSAGRTLDFYAERIANKSEELKGLDDPKRKTKLRSLVTRYKKDFANTLKLSLLLPEIVVNDENPEEVKKKIADAVQTYNKANELLKEIKEKEKAEDTEEETDNTEDSEDTEASAEEDSSEEDSFEESYEDLEKDNPFTKEEQPKKKQPVFFKPKKAKEEDGQLNLFDFL